VGVVSSNLITRSQVLLKTKHLPCPGGGIGRHVGLKIQWTLVRTGSSPVPGTKSRDEKSLLFCLEKTQLSLEVSVDCQLVVNKKKPIVHDFKKARLVKSKNKKGWYVQFYVWDIQKILSSNGRSKQD
jgi:hypothetical protein